MENVVFLANITNLDTHEVRRFNRFFSFCSAFCSWTVAKRSHHRRLRSIRFKSRFASCFSSKTRSSDLESNNTLSELAPTGEVLDVLALLHMVNFVNPRIFSMNAIDQFCVRRSLVLILNDWMPFFIQENEPVRELHTKLRLTTRFSGKHEQRFETQQFAVGCRNGVTWSKLLPIDDILARIGITQVQMKVKKPFLLLFLGYDYVHC